MRVLYVLRTAAPVVPGTDAVAREAEQLAAEFSGDVVFLGSRRAARWRLPRALEGVAAWRRLARLAAGADLVHVFGADLYLPPALRRLPKPIVYTVVTAAAGSDGRPSAVPRGVCALAVSRSEDLELLQGLVPGGVRRILPGLDPDSHPRLPAPPAEGFTLLVGSAPWIDRQFRSKGLEALLDVAARTPDVRLVFLWRGVLLDELRGRIAAAGVEDRVEVLTERVEVGRLFARVHAAVVLADKAKLVPAYPRSLLEALAAGRPILVSDRVGMAELVRETDCGRVVRGVSAEDLASQLEALRLGYDEHRAATLAVDRETFSLRTSLTAHRELYRAALES